MIDHMLLLANISSILARRVVPLYLPIGREGLSLVGTGFMVVYNNETYLITAAHVVRGEKGAIDEFLPVVAFLGEEGPIELKNFVITEKNPSTGKDDIDVAVTKISPLVGMPPYKKYDKEAFKADQFFDGPSPRSLHHYAIAGYPETKNRIKYNTKTVQTQPFIYSNNSAEDKYYLDKGLNQNHHVLINFSAQGGQGNVTEDFQFPKLRGMSGGPIVSYSPDSSANDGLWFAVVGIAQSHLVPEKMIKGTDILFVKQLIVRHNDLIKDKKAEQ